MQHISLAGEEDHLPRRMVESRMLYMNQKEGLSCDAPRFLSKRLFAESTHTLESFGEVFADLPC